MKWVKVMFENPSLDYTTPMAKSYSDEEIAKYFLGKEFNVKGTLYRCIKIGIENG